MRIASIDVGIKHLAVCVLDEAAAIYRWDVLDLSEQRHPCLVCQRAAKYWAESEPPQYYCGIHAKQCATHAMPQHKGLLHKATSATLATWMTLYHLPPATKKADMLAALQAHVRAHCLQPLTNTNAADIDLCTIGRALQRQLDAFLEDTPSLDLVLIENQISPIATRMKTIQGMLTQYVVMTPRFHQTPIQFVSSANKLKDVACTTTTDTTNTNTNTNPTNPTPHARKKRPSDKEGYQARKKMGVEVCRRQLVDGAMDRWLAWFDGHKKKDDLADAYLQGWWYVRHHASPVVVLV